MDLATMTSKGRNECVVEENCGVWDRAKDGESIG